MERVFSIFVFVSYLTSRLFHLVHHNFQHCAWSSCLVTSVTKQNCKWCNPWYGISISLRHSYFLTFIEFHWTHIDSNFAYAFKQNMTFSSSHCANFHETHNCFIHFFVDLLCRILFILDEKVENMGNVSVTPVKIYGFHDTYIQETCNCLTAWCRHLYRMTINQWKNTYRKGRN